MSNAWIFGPPGIGKSTIVKRLLEFGRPGLDFEMFWNGKQSLDWNRSNLRRIVKALWKVGDIGAVYGSAGLDPKASYPGKKVLLWLPQNAYEERRAERDRRIPAFRNQPKASTDAWKELTQWDAVLDASGKGVWREILLLLEVSGSQGG